MHLKPATAPRCPHTFRHSAIAVALGGAAFIAATAGCLVHQPPLFPLAPIAERADGGAAVREYDVNRDGKVDFAEELGADGRVAKLRWLGGDGSAASEAPWPAPGPAGSRPRVMIIADSVPFELVVEAWSGGRFRLFAPPSAIVAPFPVMTDLSLNNLFGCSPSDGVEAQYFDGKKLVGGFSFYESEKNSPWVRHVDARLPFSTHGEVYMHPYESLDCELDVIAAEIEKRKGDCIGYILATSGLGLQFGRDGHHAGLVKLDRFCQSLVYRLKGNVDITLLSDHGHVLATGRRIPYDWKLRELGYRDEDTIEKESDLVLPEFGDVSCLSVYTRAPARVAGDLAGITGVEFTFYREASGDVIVEGAAGRARVTERGTQYRYVCERGDPLQLTPIIERLRAAGVVAADGFIEDAALWEATATHLYPDPLRRICHAFEGQVSNPPQVFASLHEGYSFASPFLALFVNCAADHGSLRRGSTTGFVMSTAGPLPPIMRMENVAAAIRQRGAWPHAN